MATLIDTSPQLVPADPPDTTPYQLSQAAADLLGPDAASAANQLYAAPDVTPQNANSATSALFNAQGISALDQAQGQAQDATAEGDQQEANAYLTAASVADQNARLARVSASLQQSQEDRKIYQSVSGQQADIAGAGFGNSGSALYLTADSVHQGALADQLIGTQGEITAGGFQEQSAAANAEANAATAAGNAAGILGAEATQTAGDATTAALNSAMSLLGTGSGDGTATGTKSATTASKTPSSDIFSPSFLGHRSASVGNEWEGYVLSGSAPQVPSPFTGGAPNPWAGSGADRLASLTGT